METEGLGTEVPRQSVKRRVHPPPSQLVNAKGEFWFHMGKSSLLRHLFLTGRKLQLRLGHGLRSIVLPGIVSQTLRCDNDDRVIG